VRFPFSRRVRLGALLVVAVGFAAGGIAYASIPDPGGVIHGCYDKKSGALRVIDAGPCGNREVALNWNQGAKSFATDVSTDNTPRTLATLANGVTVIGNCNTSGHPALVIEASPSSLQVSGTMNVVPPGSVAPAVLPVDADRTGAIATGTSSEPIDLDVIARDKSAGPFARLDLDGGPGSPCTFWGMITTPSTGS